ncbi:MAG: histidine kinase, partial [Gammaproteobacteria bacterium]
MKPNGTVEYNSLSWVKSQLDAVISDAQSSLSEYIEHSDNDALMQDCIEGLRLVYGTLQMVEIFGAAMLAEEMEHTARAILEDRVDNRDDAYDVLMRALLQMPDYLEGLQSGKKDTPMVLLPLMNDMRAICKQSLLSENVLFFPDMDAVEIDEQEIEAPVVEAGKLQAEAKRLRTHYQLGLLDLLKNNKAHAGYQRMLAVIAALHKASAEQSVRRYWSVIAAVLEGLLDEGIDINVSIKMLLGHVDRQIRLVTDIGEEDFTTRYSQELLKNILYYIAHSQSSGKRVSRVREIYNLDELLSSAMEGEDAGLGGLNAELFATVSQGIKEDLVQVKDALEIFIHSNDRNVSELTPLAEQLLRIGDTYGMLGLGDARQNVLEQKNKIESITEGHTEA